jgi:hypothetical protein
LSVSILSYIQRWSHQYGINWKSGSPSSRWKKLAQY